MPEGSLTLRVKVPRDRGTKEYPSRPRGVSRETRLVTEPSRGVTEGRWWLQTAAREIALPIVPERCSWRSCSRVSCKGLVGPRV